MVLAWFPNRYITLPMPYPQISLYTVYTIKCHTWSDSKDILQEMEPTQLLFQSFAAFRESVKASVIMSPRSPYLPFWWIYVRYVQGTRVIIMTLEDYENRQVRILDFNLHWGLIKKAEPKSFDLFMPLINFWFVHLYYLDNGEFRRMNPLLRSLSHVSCFPNRIRPPIIMFRPNSPSEVLFHWLLQCDCLADSQGDSAPWYSHWIPYLLFLKS